MGFRPFQKRAFLISKVHNRVFLPCLFEKFSKTFPWFDWEQTNQFHSKRPSTCWGTKTRFDLLNWKHRFFFNFDFASCFSTLSLKNSQKSMFRRLRPNIQNTLLQVVKYNLAAFTSFRMKKVQTALQKSALGVWKFLQILFLYWLAPSSPITFRTPSFMLRTKIALIIPLASNQQFNINRHCVKSFLKICSFIDWDKTYIFWISTALYTVFKKKFEKFPISKRFPSRIEFKLNNLTHNTMFHVEQQKHTLIFFLVWKPHCLLVFIALQKYSQKPLRLSARALSST